MKVFKKKAYFMIISVILIAIFVIVFLLQKSKINTPTSTVPNGPFTVSSDYTTFSEKQIDFTIEYPKSWDVQNVQYYPASTSTPQITPSFAYQNVSFATLSTTDLFRPVICPKMDREYTASNRNDTNIVIETCSICDTEDSASACKLLNAQIYFIPGYKFTNNNGGGSVSNEIGFGKFHSIYFNGEVYQSTVFPDKLDDIKSILRHMAESINITTAEK